MDSSCDTVEPFVASLMAAKGVVGAQIGTGKRYYAP
jgi:hypothetical protein